MKKTILIFSLGLWAVAHVYALTWEQTTIEITPKDGEATVTAHFRFTNKTDVPVLIKKAASSCSECTELVWEEKAYAPGESGDLIAMVKLVGLSGKKTKYLTVETTEKTKFPDRLILTIITPEKISLAEKVLHVLLWVSGEGKRGARSSLPQKNRIRAR